VSNNYKPLPKEFYLSNDVCQLAQLLLGKYLISKIDKKLCVTKIVETEAYKAPEDKGSHAYNNKITARTNTMFAEGGRSYVYLCYGIHNMFNVVTGPTGTAHAILVRAVEPIFGIKFIAERRNIKDIKNLTNGPGKVCHALGITREDNNKQLYLDNKKIYLADNNPLNTKDIYEGPRVGIAYAEECANWPFRFYIKDNPWVSHPKIVKY